METEGTDNETWIRGMMYLDEILSVNCTEVTQIQHLTYGILFPIFIIFGMLGNVLNLIIFTRPLLQTVPYTFARSRAVSDLLANVSFVPFVIQMAKPINVWSEYWAAVYYAKLQMWIINSLLGISALYVTAFTLERYLFVRKPLKMYIASKHRQKTLFAVTIIPLLTPIIHIPYCFTMDIEYGYNRFTNCSQYTYHDSPKIVDTPIFVFYMLLLQSLFRIGPTLTVLILNINIVFQYRKIVKKRLQLTKSDSTTHRRSEEKRLMLLLFGTSIVFFVCNSPAAILSVTFHDNLRCRYGFQLFRAIANILETVNSALPIVIYLAFSEDFRKTAVGLVRKSIRVDPRIN